MNLTEIVVAAFTLIGIVLPSYLAYLEKTKNRKKDLRILELEYALDQSSILTQELQMRSAVVERLLDITFLSDIKKAVSEMFDESKAERFLILIAVNGKTDFNIVSVIFEQHKNNHHINAIARYRNVQIDTHYKDMLKRAERQGVVELNVAEMPEEGLLTHLYRHEGVKHSKVRFLLREHIDNENDVIIFSTIATFSDEPFTLEEKALFLTQYNSSIIPALKAMINSHDWL